MADCVPQLEKFRYAAFMHPEHSLEGPQDPGEGMAWWSFGNVFTCPFQGPPASVPEELLNEVMVIYSMQQGAISIIPINVSGRQLDRSEAE